MKNQIFKNEEFGQIRTCMVKGETYFVGKDVASALGYVHPTKAVTTHVDEEDRIMTKTVTIQGKRDTTFINESTFFMPLSHEKADET